MEYFWKENKKFVMAVGGGFLFVILYNSFVLGPIRKGSADAIRDRSKAKSEIDRRMQQGVPTDDGLVSGRKDRDQNRRLLTQMVPEVAYTLGDRFIKPRKENVKTYYDNLKLDLVKELQKKATDGNVAPPQTFGVPDDVSEETAVEVLARLAVVERVVTLAVESGVDKIEVVDGQYGMERDDRSSKKSQFLTKYSVFMKFSAKQQSVFRLIHGVQKKGTYLAVTHFDMSRTDQTKDLFDVSIAVSYLKVDDKGALEAR
ncbi:MAG: hypothetical protein HY293_03580 [Planctomycetes bacterium]|nr:hypothetical protein [Planctomycetota bacterium]